MQMKMSKHDDFLISTLNFFIISETRMEMSHDRHGGQPQGPLKFRQGRVKRPEIAAKRPDDLLPFPPLQQL